MHTLPLLLLTRRVCGTRQVEARLAAIAFVGALCQRAGLQRFLASCHAWAALLTATLNTAGTPHGPNTRDPADGSGRGVGQGAKAEKGANRFVGPEGSLERGEGSAREGERADEGGGGAMEAEGGRRGGDAGGVPGVRPGAHILRAAAFAALTDLVTR